jgi:16S rRNA U1498 N3-methylase RsmE
MVRKIVPLSDFISASDAAALLSKKFGRRIRPDYIHQLKNVRSVKVNERCRLYNKHDIEACEIKKKEQKKA